MDDTPKTKPALEMRNGVTLFVPTIRPGLPRPGLALINSLRDSDDEEIVAEHAKYLAKKKNL